MLKKPCMNEYGHIPQCKMIYEQFSFWIDYHEQEKDRWTYPSEVTSMTESETGFEVTEAKLDNDFWVFGAVMTCRMVIFSYFHQIQR